MVSLNIQNGQSRRLTFKKLLYHPLTWLALGLHALLLAVPMGADSPPEAAEPEAEDVAVDILNLSEIATTKPPSTTSPPVTGTPTPPGAKPAAPLSATSPATAPVTSPVTAPPAAIAPRPTYTAPSNLAPITPAPIPTAYSQLPAASATNAATAAPAGSGNSPTAPAGSGSSPTAPQPVPPQPVYDPGQDRGVFISGLQNLGVPDNTATVGLPNDPRMFRHPDSFGFFIDNQNPASPQPIAGARDARWLGQQKGDLLATLQTTYAQSNITFDQSEDYGGESLYELRTDQGQVVMYVSLVDLKGSSLLVMWENKPV
jgi:hypothetical protein